MAWEKPEGARPEIKAEFWAPKAPSETVVGIVEGFSDSRHGTYITLRPVIHYPAQGEPKGYGSVLVGLNSWLAKVVNPSAHTGKPVAIVFKGTTPTPSGAMRTYDVYTLTDQQWETERVVHLAMAPDDDDSSLPF